MKLEIPFNVEVRGEASSSFTLEHIEDRLTVLRLRDDDAAREEIVYLERVKEERFGE